MGVISLWVYFEMYTYTVRSIEARHKKNHSLKQSDRHNPRAKLSEIDIKESVMVKDFGSRLDWIPGNIAQKLGPLTYQVYRCLW